MFIDENTICTQEKQEDGTILLRFYGKNKNVLFEKVYPSWKASNIAKSKLFRKYCNLREQLIKR